MLDNRAVALGGLLLAALANGGAGMALAGDAAPTWGVRLGFPAERKVLILHADDVGMSYEANAATRHYLEQQAIQSASVMAPCPWFDAFVDWAKDRENLDIGLHLTLTSEWELYRWRPLSPRSLVPGLFDENGFMHRAAVDVARQSNPKEVETELRAQLEHALQRGLQPTHLDTHMGVVYARPDFTAAYMALAEEFQIPAMVIELTEPVIAEFREQGYPIDQPLIELVQRYPLPKLDRFYSMTKGNSYAAVRDAFFERVRGLPPGITQIVLHPSEASDAMKRITNRWQQRAWEARLFTDPEVQAFLKGEAVLFTTWREMMQRHQRR